MNRTFWRTRFSIPLVTTLLITCVSLALVPLLQAKDVATHYSIYPNRSKYLDSTEVGATADSSFVAFMEPPQPPETGRLRAFPLTYGVSQQDIDNDFIERNFTTELTDAIFSKLEPGAINVVAPSRMQARNSYLITATLAQADPLQPSAFLGPVSSQPTASESEERMTSAVKIAASMTAHLEGRTFFKVTPLIPERQLVSTQKETIWRWEVTANYIGILPLYLNVSAHFATRVSLDDELQLCFLICDIEVYENYWGRSRHLFEKHWQWITTAIFVQLFGIWLQARLSRTRAPQTTGTRGQGPIEQARPHPESRELEQLEPQGRFLDSKLATVAAPNTKRRPGGQSAKHKERTEAKLNKPAESSNDQPSKINRTPSD